MRLVQAKAYRKRIPRRSTSRQFPLISFFIFDRVIHALLQFSVVLDCLFVKGGKSDLLPLFFGYSGAGEKKDHSKLIVSIWIMQQVILQCI